VRRRPVPEPSSLPLLDRLIDDEPFVSSEPPPARDEASIAGAIRESIARDLEILLNTRQRLVQPPWARPEPTASIVDFGLPAARGTNLATAAGRKEFARAIEGAIRCFEPRLREVQVSLEPGATPLDPLRVAITAKLTAGRADEPIALEASWAGGSAPVRIGEGRP
jgi:type VI secretion system protein ImpF